MPDCAPENILRDPVGCAVQAVAGSGLKAAAAEATAGVNDLWDGFLTSWIGAPIDGALTGAAADWFQSAAAPVVVLLLVLGLVIAGARTAFSLRGEPAAEVAPKLLRALLIQFAGAAGFTVLVAGSNALAKWILDTSQTTVGDPFLGEALMLAENALLGLLFGLLGIIVVGVQWGIMLVRGLALTALVPFWPIAASAALTDKYEGAYEKITAWLIAFLVYSPVAAGLYGLAFKLRAGTDGVDGVLYGLGLSVLAIVALPALMRLLVPATAAMGRAGAWQMMMGGAAVVATTAVAVGATVATGGAAAPAAAAAGGAAARGAGAAASGATASAAGTAAGGAAGGSAAAASPTAAPSGAAPPAMAGGGRTGGPGPNVPDSAAGPAGSAIPAASSGAAAGSAETNGTTATGGGGSWGAARDVLQSLPRAQGARVEEMIDE